MSTLHTVEIKQLLTDARRLTTIAKHLRKQAKALTNENNAEARALRVQTNFFAKPAAIDPNIPLVPIVPEELNFDNKGGG